MATTVIDGKLFARMIQQGANHLAANAKYVDSLNVFPVPDGDTGTNMNLSMSSGAKEVRQNFSEHVGELGKAFSKGLLMGARGNSGVILSQLFRGFGKAIENKETLNAQDLAAAFQAGVETAYKAVMKPVEGTILTVARESAQKAVETAAKTDDIITVMEETVKEAKASLERTPDLLPVLKEVGVVDSGGQGLVFVLEGFLAELKGIQLTEIPEKEVSMEQLVKQEHHKSVQSYLSTEDIEFGYCTEFMVKLDHEKLGKPFSEEKFRNDISRFGDSLLVISDDEIVKVHIHTERPGDVLNFGQQFGELINLKIENMRQQHTAILEADQQPASESVRIQAPAKEKEYGFVTVSMGSGIKKLFTSIGVDQVIEGGQTMNPSTEDIVKAIEEVNARKIFVLPNNKNIILAAEQARDMTEKEVIVIPTKSVPQGISAILAFNSSADIETNTEAMIEALEHVKSGQVTFAVRDTKIDGLTIKKDDFIGILDGDIITAHPDLLEASKELIRHMLDEDSEILTVIVGENVEQDVVDTIETFVEEQFPDVEIEIHEGNQPLYPFILAVE
ncbi:MAG: DAK2 domain-containing protein [Caldibacillus sp.]